MYGIPLHLEFISHGLIDQASFWGMRVWIYLHINLQLRVCVTTAGGDVCMGQTYVQQYASSLIYCWIRCYC